LQAASQHDAEMKRPVPLQVLSSATAGSYRLYAGRDYVEFAGPTSKRGRPSKPPLEENRCGGIVLKIAGSSIIKSIPAKQRPRRPVPKP